jgi:iron-sulfur cluster repair protein YtfE (RIC family)
MIQSRVMITEREFARIRGVMLRLRDLTHEYASPHGPCEMCHELLSAIQTLLGDLRRHAEKELGVLYPWAVERERKLAT